MASIVGELLPESDKSAFEGDVKDGVKDLNVVKYQSIFYAILLVMVVLLVPAWAQETDRDLDADLTSKLRAAFRQVGDLEQVTLEVRGGVAVLRGTVPSIEDKRAAEELAAKVDGVLIVDNGIEVDTDVSRRLRPAMSRVYEEVTSLAAHLPLLLLAGAVFVFFVSMGGLIRRWERLYNHLSKNLFIQDLYRQATSLVALLVGSLVALEILDATALVGAVLGAAGVMGLAIGFAFRDVAENSLASVLLGLRQPFEPNDLVNVNGHEGRVIRLTSRATVLMTLDGNHVRIPNSDVFKATIINYTHNPGRRFRFEVRVGEKEDISRVRALAIKLMLKAPGVLEDPAPQCRVEELGDFGTILGMYGWVDQQNFDFLKVKSESIRIVKEGYDQAGVSMPGPFYSITQRSAEESKEMETPAHLDIEPASDVSVDRHLEHLVQEERQTAGESDLLRTDGPVE